MFAIGTAAPTTLELDLAGGVVTPTAITIDNVNQTLEIGPLGALVVDATQNVTNGTILMAGGLLTDTLGISFGAAALSGSLSGFGTVTGPLTRSGSGTANTITAIDGNLTLTTAIGSNSGLVFTIGSTAGSTLQLDADAGSRKYLHVPGISRRTGAYRRRSERVRRHNRRPQCRKHPNAHESGRHAW